MNCSNQEVTGGLVFLHVCVLEERERGERNRERERGGQVLKVSDLEK